MTAAFSAEPDLKYLAEVSVEACPGNAWTWAGRRLLAEARDEGVPAAAGAKARDSRPAPAASTGAQAPRRIKRMICQDNPLILSEIQDLTTAGPERDKMSVSADEECTVIAFRVR
jgi:hypothetical protein